MSVAKHSGLGELWVKGDCGKSNYMTRGVWYACVSPIPCAGGQARAAVGDGNFAKVRGAAAACSETTIRAAIILAGRCRSLASSNIHDICEVLEGFLN
uniref:NifU_N domain-containing protein n=1 Tax=Angiostrongylus cantonensis TaxID=6313 RepID=A0A0K0DI26_ANGCA